MKKERYMTKSAVFLLVRDGDRVLLQKRKNTGYLDGYYDLSASGHVEEGESLVDAVIRESKEEIGLDLREDQVHFFTVVHYKSTDEVYYHFYFYVDLDEDLKSKIEIGEVNKIEEIKWFDLGDLPEKMGPHNKLALEHLQAGTHLGVLGFDN